MRLYETKKLHYNKYLYKLVLYNKCANYFRTEFQQDGHYNYARQKLDILSQNFDSKKSTIIVHHRKWNDSIPVEDYYDAIEIFRYLKKSKKIDFRVRCEVHTLIIYSCDRAWLLGLNNKLRKTIEFWEPNPKDLSVLNNEKNIIIVNKEPEYLYKVTLGKRPGNPSLAKWIDANPKLGKIGEIAKQECYNSGWVKGYYFHVRDDKALTIAQMIVGNNIQRIDKFVYNTE